MAIDKVVQLGLSHCAFKQCRVSTTCNLNKLAVLTGSTALYILLKAWPAV